MERQGAATEVNHSAHFIVYSLFPSQICCGARAEFEPTGAAVAKAGLSLWCSDCGMQLRSVEEAQAHTEVTNHANFVESTEAVLNLVCSDCGKPCHSQTEVDLHTKRTGHKDFADKTAKAAKPIDLEASLNPASSSEAMDVDAPASAIEKPQDILQKEEDWWDFFQHHSAFDSY
ncbi:hypothetical protein GQ55_8G178100 [Panicum hallii var. hallii]|uniref:C2H2-type domain-containing protein n=1 Tax=Panicum hallii var. hallii TaxID=1504633 RepID=A0A2T7CNP0_9POAL|nr:hypothetical protein GQ55_8G178100 [Panicum hallii var. hallii]